MHRYFAFLIPLYVVVFQSLAQAAELERANILGVQTALEKVESAWNAHNVQDLTIMTAEPFSLITPDGVYRSLYFRPHVHDLLSNYFDGGAGDRLELEFSSFSLLNENAAYLQATGSLGEKDIVITALLRKFGDNWKANNIHISSLHEKKFVRDE